MRSEKTRSNLNGSKTVYSILLACGLSCSMALADQPAKNSKPNTKQSSLDQISQSNPGLITSSQIQGREVRSILIDNMQGQSSMGSLIDVRGIKVPYFFRNELVVRANDWDAVSAEIKSIAATNPGVQLGRKLGNKGHFRVVHAPNVGIAFEVQRALADHPAVFNVEVDAGAVTQRTIQTPQQTTRSSNSVEHIGITPVDSPQNPQSIPAAQWHFTNNGANGFPGHDNNIPESIYSTDQLTGAGVVVGLVSRGSNVHLDIDHSDLVANYRPNLSQPNDPLFPDSSELTKLAGIVAAERTSPVVPNDLQGVAPGAGVAVLYRGPTALLESQGYEWKNNSIGIKVHDLDTEYENPSSGYNTGGFISYVKDSFENSILFGRGRKGTIHIFGTAGAFDFGAGLPTNTLPDPYLFGTPYAWEPVRASKNIISVTATNAFTSGPFYMGGQTHGFPIANDRNSLIINTVSEDGNIDSFGAIGTGVFASVFAGSTNQFWSFSQNTSGRGILTTEAGDLQDLMPIAAASPQDLTYANLSGASVAAGIVALMLEANPNLKIRDLQHIFFQSIQESTRPAAVKWPNWNLADFYYVPDSQSPAVASFWQLNSGLYTGGGVENQTVRHSDQYGFGVIDAELAIQKAKTWGNSGRLVLLDSNIVGDANDGGIVDENENRVPLEIPDATFSEPDPEPDGPSGTDGEAFLIPGETVEINFCVRQNISIENIIIELTIAGEGSNDLFIELVSPTNTRSILAYPTTRNFSGMSVDTTLDDDESDLVFTSGVFNGTEYAYYQHPFLTYKHWGEFSGGLWTIRFTDYGVDAVNPEGVEAADPDPAVDMNIDLGELGIPGSNFRTAKTVAAFRVRIYGTDTGLDPFFGCDPTLTPCPADLNADGIVNRADMIMFVDWLLAGDTRADLNDTGTLDYFDFMMYLALYNQTVGFCVPNNAPPFYNGRPMPGSSGPSDNSPVTRPI